MAIYYLSVKSFSRGAGQRGSRATSAAAYRAGERIRDERTGAVYNHTQRKDVLHKEIMLPERIAAVGQDLSWAQDRARLWNAAEHAESRSNARVAREYTVALPHELDPAQQVVLARSFGRELADRYGCAVDMVIHSPRHDPRNFHAHLLTTTREVTSDGLGRKTAAELSGTERHKRGLVPAAEEFREIRGRWAALTNEALREAQVSARVSHLGRHAEIGQHSIQSAEPSPPTTGLDRLEQIQQEARSNWLHFRRQEISNSQGSAHARDNSQPSEEHTSSAGPSRDVSDNDRGL
jgi:ATP-dependent exoDNAse (exonuclease V) alpha subunit